MTGLVLQHPEVRRLRQAHPAARIVGDWGTRLDGRDVRVVGVREEHSATGLDVVLDPVLTPVAVVQVLPVR